MRQHPATVFLSEHRSIAQVPQQVEVHEPAPTPVQLAQRALTPAIAPIETTFIVLVVTIFIPRPPANSGRISKPEASGFSPNPSWNIVGSRNGAMVADTRNNDPPRKVIA